MRFLQTVLTIWQREIIRYGRDRTRILTTILQPLMFLAIFGAGLRQTLARASFGVDFVQFMYPGIIAMNVMGVAFFSTVSTVWDRQFGFLKEILVAPVSRTAISLGKTLGATTIAGLQASILLILAPFIGLSLNLKIVPGLFVVMVLLSLVIAGLGLLIASLMQTTESFGLLVQVLIFPMFFLSGAFFPLTAVPTWMDVLAKINPLTYGVDALRGILLRGQVSSAVLERLSLHPVVLDVVFLGFFAFVMLSAAVQSFNRRV